MLTSLLLSLSLHILFSVFYPEPINISQRVKLVPLIEKLQQNYSVYSKYNSLVFCYSLFLVLTLFLCNPHFLVFIGSLLLVTKTMHLDKSQSEYTVLLVHTMYLY